MKKPDIYLFNPTCDFAIANGTTSWQPNRLLQKMESDLATRPLFFAKAQDYILVDDLPSESFLSVLQKLDIEIPHFFQKDKLRNESFLRIQKNGLKPWGWSPVVHKFLHPLKKNCSAEFLDSPVSYWKPTYKELYSKAFGLGVLKKMLAEYPDESFIETSMLPERCTSKDEIELLLNRWGKLMVKAPWSSSGRGLQPITKTPIHPKVWDKLLGYVNEQGYVIVEPYLDKALDLALQFTLEKEKISYLGTSNFSADKNGQYLGNSLNGLSTSLSIEVLNFAGNIQKKILPILLKQIEQSELAKNYEGNFGVDLLLFRNQNNKLRVNPCLEINVRQNMGLLSLYLEKLIVPNKKGIFRIHYKKGHSFSEFKTDMEQKYPLQLTSNKIESGFFAITEAKKNTQFGAYLLV